MKKSSGGFIVCLLGLAACNFEHYEDCNGDELDIGDDDAFGGSVHSIAGSSWSGAWAGEAGSTSSTGAQAGSSGAQGGAGGSGAAPVVPDSCDAERDCDPGYNCNFISHECQPAAEETCGELTTEVACSHRSDCTPIYGGTNCSCGQDCECHGGEPGCVCESFQFFVCQPAE